MKNNLQPNYLFVYGTLRKGFGLPILKKIESDIQYLGNSEINGELYDIGKYPAALPAKKSSSKILGEVFVILRPRKVFKLLDSYEGFDRKDKKHSEYYQKKELLVLDSGEKIYSLVYWYNLPIIDKNRITQSDYLIYLSKMLE